MNEKAIHFLLRTLKNINTQAAHCYDFSYVHIKYKDVTDTPFTE